MATHSRILAWRIPQTEEPGGLYSPWGHKESDTTEAINTHCRFTALYNKVSELYVYIYSFPLGPPWG